MDSIFSWRDNISCRKIFQDDMSTNSMVSHEGVTDRSKNIDVKFHFVVKLRSDVKAEFPHSILAEMCEGIFTKDLSDDFYARYAAVMQGFIPHA